MSGQEARDSTPGGPLLEYAGFQFGYRNRDEFTRICQDVFDDHEYGFATRERSPLIIDAGAHVGAATHYFKRRYPGARVFAYEANPVTFRLLQQNIARNRLEGVVATHAALAPEPGEITFYAAATDDEPGAWGDSLIRQPWHDNEATAAVRVPAVTLSSILTEPVDLLKLDIEGMETAVLAEAAPRLALVKRVVLEFHGTRRNPDNSINKLTEILREAGLTPEIRQFGEIIAIPNIQRDDPFWLMVRAERLNGVQRLWRMFG